MGERWQFRPLTFPMTAVSGITLLMEGSTVRDGKYCEPIRRARDWLLARQHPNGLIGVGGEWQREEGFSYMHGHGLATLFLACLVGEEENAEQRRRLSEAVEKACRFIRDAQTSQGGCGGQGGGGGGRRRGGRRGAGGAPGNNPNSNGPQQDSMGDNACCTGAVDAKKFRKAAQVWGKLPEKERAKAMPELTRDMPARYREVIEKYFKEMAKTSDTDK